MKLHETVSALAGENTYHAIVEIPAEGKVKYEYDPKTGVILVDRFINTAFSYPCNYGFIPQTLAGDHDPIDVLVITPEPLLPGSVIEVRPIGVLMMTDEKGPDEKILCLATEKSDPSHAHIQEYKDLNPSFLAKLKHFFEHYKDLDKEKWVKLENFENKAKAIALIKASIANAAKIAQKI